MDIYFIAHYTPHTPSLSVSAYNYFFHICVMNEPKHKMTQRSSAFPQRLINDRDLAATEYMGNRSHHRPTCLVWKTENRPAGKVITQNDNDDVGYCCAFAFLQTRRVSIKCSLTSSLFSSYLGLIACTT